MEASCEFPSVVISDLAASSAAEEAKAVFTGESSGETRLKFVQAGSVSPLVELDLETTQVFRLGPLELLCVSEESSEKRPFSRALKVGLKTEEESKAFSLAFERWNSKNDSKAVALLENGAMVSSKSKFDSKIEATSAKMYFHYYGQLLHQQNMLQDFVRTGTYYAAVIENRSDFEGRVVVDVGAGSGILSLFAAQAGAKHVYAVEASEMAEYAHKLVSGNPSLGQRITVVKGKVEEVELPEKADILISEPMGTLLVNERMLETYIIARERFLTPNGKMFPTLGRMHMAPFSDEYLYVEIANKALFWQQQNFFGVDLTPLHSSAFQGYFSQPVVDAFDPRLLVSPSIYHTLDFTHMKEEDLYEIDIPLNFIASVGTRVHGLACWFDVLFNGSTVQRWLTTAPGSPTTHWYQLRCVLQQPLYVMAGQQITGRLHLVAHSSQSYTIYLTMSTLMHSSSGKMELKEPYYRLSQPLPVVSSDQQLHQQPQIIQPQDVPLQLHEDVDANLNVEPNL